jgi:hypothetical protein
VSIKSRAEAKTSIICVVEGEMNVMHVKAEMERLLPAKTTWVLQEIAKD